MVIDVEGDSQLRNTSQPFWARWSCPPGHHFVVNLTLPLTFEILQALAIAQTKRGW